MTANAASVGGEFPEPDLLITFDQDQADLLERLSTTRALPCDSPLLDAELSRGGVVALINSERLAAWCFAAGVAEVLLVQVHPSFRSLQEALGAPALPRELTEDELEKVRLRWDAILWGAHLLDPKDYPSSVNVNGVGSVNGSPCPVHVLPPVWRAMIELGARAQGVDVGFWFVPSIAAITGAIGNSRILRLKNSYSEPSVTWCTTVAPSGAGKSPPLDALFEPHRRRDMELAELSAELMRKYMQEVAARKARGAHQDGHAAQSDGELQVPPRLATVVDDVTMEALIALLADNQRGLTLVRDELSGWIGGFDAYRSGRGGDEAKWLSIHRAGPVKSDRKVNRATIAVHRAAVSVAGTIQPGVLRRVMFKKREAGFPGRIFMAMPQVTAAEWNENDIPLDVIAAYDRVVTVLLDIVMCEAPIALTLSSAARSAWKRYHDRVAREIARAQKEGDGDMAAALAKLKGGAVRLALAIALARAAEQGLTVAEQLREVAVEDMESAITLARWFVEQARVIYALWRIGENEPEDLVVLIDHHGGTVTVRQLMRHTRRFRNAQEARAALDALVAMGKGNWVSRKATNGKDVPHFVLDADAVDTADADGVR